MAIELIARAEPLATLRAAVARAEAARGGLELVVGEPGIGKTTLVSAIAAEAEARGIEVVHGRAWELGESPPYFPLWECFRSLGVERGDGADAFGLWERVLAALAAASPERTVLWVLEDLHAADLLTLDLLTFLARPLRAMRVVVLATARDKDPRISARAAQRLTRMARDGEEIRLGPLPKAAALQLVERVSGRPLPGLADAIFSRTEGNPLFAVECAHLLKDAGPAAFDALRSLPSTVRQIVLERVAPLPEETRDALAAGALLGRDFTSGRAANLLGRLPAQVIEALRPALDAGLVIEKRPGSFAFTHILVRDAIEDSIGAATAVKLHTRAEALLAGEGDGMDTVVERARHALAAMKDDALPLARRAAEALERAGSFDRALALHERIDDARAKGELPALTAEEKLHRARLLREVGRHPDADALCEAIAQGARAAGDGALLARAALARGSELRPAMVDAGLVALLRAALAMPSGDPRLDCVVRARLAAALQPAPDPRAPNDLARSAITSARELGDEKLMVDVLNWAGAAFVDSAPLEERVALNEELFAGAMREGETALALRAQLRLGLDRLELGQLAAWPDRLARVREIASMLGHPRHRWRSLLFASMWSVARGDAVGSDRALVELKELSGLHEDAGFTLSYGAHVGQVACLFHRDEDIRQTIAIYERPLAPNIADAAAIGAILRFGCFAQLEDIVALEGILRTDGAHLERSLQQLEIEPGFFLATYAHGIALVGEPSECRRLRALYVGREKQHVVSGHVSVTYEGPVSRICALLDARSGDVDAAEQALRAAIVEAKAHGLQAWVVQMEYDLGRILSEAGRAALAEPVLESAERGATALGMSGLATRAAARRTRPASSSNAAPASPVALAAPTSFGLVREGDVWLVRYGDREVRVKDSRGMQLLGRLVERPGEDIHVLALGSDETGKSLAEGASGPVIDARARAEYKERLDDLREEIDAAEAHADRGRLERLVREKEAIESELAATLGAGGKARAGGGASERARVNVQRRLRDAIARVTELDPSIGAFLERAVRTGTYCRFGI